MAGHGGVLQRVVPENGVAADVSALDDKWKTVSGHLVRLVQILFGVVAGQSLLLYRDVVTSPFHHSTIVAALALLSIYLMIVWSWIDWNITMEEAPYDFRTHADVRGGRFIEHSERFRLYSDIAIVTIYAYLLFQVNPLVDDPGADLRYLLIGYPAVFTLYLVSGVLRILRHGRKMSSIPPILMYLTMFVAILIWYIGVRQTDFSNFTLNVITLVVATVAMRSYRWYRRRWRARRAK
jgi:hypothetical protein